MNKGKTYAFVLIVIILVMNCCQKQAVDTQAEAEKLKAMIYELFEVIDRHDYQALRALCTEDFVLFEAGKMMNMDETIEFLHPFKGKGEVTRKFQDMKVHLDDTAAWIHLRHKALRTWNGHKRDIEWFESAGFRKEKGVWKFALYHNSVINLIEQ
jgi:ketosteroid isomerase-like protein